MVIPENLLPIKYRQSYCVAGGWAACPALANDMDVWVYRVPVADLMTARVEILAHLATVNKSIRPRSFYVESQDSPTRIVEGFDSYLGLDVSILKVAMVEPKLGRRSAIKPIHLMVCSAPSVQQILQGFDVSTHAVAINWNGEVHQHPFYTPPHQAPEQLLYNEKTANRMVKIAKRYGHPVPLEVAIG